VNRQCSIEPKAERPEAFASIDDDEFKASTRETPLHGGDSRTLPGRFDSPDDLIKRSISFFPSALIPGNQHGPPLGAYPRLAPHDMHPERAPHSGPEEALVIIRLDRTESSCLAIWLTSSELIWFAQDRQQPGRLCGWKAPAERLSGSSRSMVSGSGGQSGLRSTWALNVASSGIAAPESPTSVSR